jgi:hypothetical protein
VDETGSGSCPVAGFGISGVESCGIYMPVHTVLRSSVRVVWQLQFNAPTYKCNPVHEIPG